MKSTILKPLSTKYSFASLFFALCLSVQLGAQCPKLIWSDEFDGTTVDQTKWSYQLGDGCDINLCQWGNNELQWYTQSNTQVSNGTLKIIAKKETMQNRSYTSSRIRTLGKADIKYGRIEARMKMPMGKGIWPAFWMLPTDNTYGGWPQSGEIDVLEYLGHEPATILGTIHFGNLWPNNSYLTKTFTTTVGDYSDGFHNYALEWTENDIKWFIDGYLYSSKSRADVGNLRWPFDQKFHFLLNLAVGGNLPGNPNSSTTFPQIFEIDYVRVYDLVGAPYLSGSQKVAFMAKSSAYSLANVPTGSTIAWTIPAGATIASGAGTQNILINWGATGGKITATVTNSCGETKYELGVQVEPSLKSAIILENFDTEGKITRTANSGVFTDNSATPSPNMVNNSALCGKYVRNSSQQYDALFYDVADVTNAVDFSTSEKKFYIDINTNAPIGTTILLQLENKTQAQPANYPTGRHSRYTVTTTKQNEWERLAFEFMDKPDVGVASSNVNQMVFLFASNSFTGATYYFDNFEIYAKFTTITVDIDKDNLISLSPNPVSDILTIKNPKNRTIDFIEIADISGKKVLFQKNINKTETQINIQSLQSGTYYLSISMDNAIKSTKVFVKQ